MHRHNLTLIAEYAGDSLGDEARARARVETCDVCRAEYETQKSVAATLSSVQSPSMTEMDRAQLRRDVWTSLRNPSSPAPVRHTWTTWAAGATAALLVTVGLVGLLNQMNGADTAETFSEIGSALDGESRENGAATATTAASDGFTAAPAAESDYFYDDSTNFAAVAKSVLSAPDQTLKRSATAEEAECLERSGLISYTIAPDAEELTSLLVAVSDEPGDADPSVAFIDRATCEVIHVEE